ncbi:MAG: type II toxin-antitoxin system HicA family toxin [Dehalococcoidia bacterium]
MTKLPVISGGEAVRAFEKNGWKVVRRAKNKHIILKKEGRPTTLSIPEHGVLDRGLLKALIRDAYISIEEFNELLKR